MAKSRDEIWDEWQDLVNMAPKELEDWLETEESKSVGDSDGGESTGHESPSSEGSAAGATGLRITVQELRIATQGP